ncbi:apolipoprotein N-acyltransferase [Sorangium sp. So ce1389]|uniref:apolipoprotein N-acyltransferase n=1 Tax=Sorangium sp. So ce1389 TaxID=3133336 RepID=UPI003F613D2B
MNNPRHCLERRPARARWSVLLGGALASALLLALYAQVEAPWFALGFVALAPWLLALERAASLGEAAAAGAAMSVAFVASVFSWLPGTFERYAQASSPCAWLLFLALAPLLEPQLVAFALVRHAARRAPGRIPALRAAFAAACAYVGTELLAPKLFFDTLGQGLYPSLALRQVADIAGVHGLTLLLLLVNEGVAETLRRAMSLRAAAPGRVAGGEPWLLRPGRALLPLAGALALVIAASGYGHVRYAEVAAGSRSSGYTIGLVQANITSYDKLLAEKGAFASVRTILDAHYALSDELHARARPDLIVWPETVYPTTFGAAKSEAGAALDAEIEAFVKGRGVPLVFGAYDAEDGREFNAAFFVPASPAGRPSASSYRKRMLFPLTEWVPGALDSDWLRRLLPWAGRWERGPGPQVIELPLRGGKRVSVVPLICYDAVFPGFVAEAARMGADLIVTLSNDSWFPDGRAPRLHLISAAFRSVETRLPQVRATNSGISAMITPAGEIVAATRWGAREALAAGLPEVERRATPAMSWGRWLGPASLSAASLLLFTAMARGRGAVSAPSAVTAPPVVTAGGERPRTRARRRNRRSGR